MNLFGLVAVVASIIGSVIASQAFGDQMLSLKFLGYATLFAVLMGQFQS